LLHAVEQGETSATERLLCLLTTKFTGFFRNPRHFDFAAEHAMRTISERGQARLWSAGVATGEEAWSLAMSVIEAFGRNDPPASVFATDVDTEALATAHRGEYAGGAFGSLSPARRNCFFGVTGVPQRWSIAPALRRLVEFQALNLVSEDWPIEGPFDAIFCRNVLMYLETRHRHAVLERLASLLAPNGLLMLDPAEHLGKAGHLFVPGADGVYSLRRGVGHTPIRNFKLMGFAL
jgi:chemotaxis protein methyltransferase CheR